MIDLSILLLLSLQKGRKQERKDPLEAAMEESGCSREEVELRGQMRRLGMDASTSFASPVGNAGRSWYMDGTDLHF